MHVRRSGIRSIRRATLWAFSNFGFGSSARTFVSVRCLAMSCAAFRVLFLYGTLKRGTMYFLAVVLHLRLRTWPPAPATTRDTDAQQTPNKPTYELVFTTRLHTTL